MSGKVGTGGQGGSGEGTNSTCRAQPANAKKRAANAALFILLKIVPLACVYISLNAGAFLLHLYRCLPQALRPLLQLVGYRLQPCRLALGNLCPQGRIAPARECQQHRQHGDHIQPCRADDGLNL